MFGLALWQVLLIFTIVVLIIIPYRMVFRKAGFPANYGLLMCIPGVNIFMLWFLALGQWPSLVGKED